MKYRVKHTKKHGYTAEVCIFLNWYRIGVHCDGYGLYDYDMNGFETEEEAINICKKYKDFCKKEEATYIELDI